MNFRFWRKKKEVQLRKELDRFETRRIEVKNKQEDIDNLVGQIWEHLKENSLGQRLYRQMIEDRR